MEAGFVNNAESDEAIANNNVNDARRGPPPELAGPEVVLRNLPSDDDDEEKEDYEEEEGPETAQKSALSVPGPVYASTYTNSPSWMSTYTSSTRATTYTTAHERSRRDRDADGDWLDVRSHRPPYPRRPRTSRGDARTRSFGAGQGQRSAGWGFGTGSGTGSGIEVVGWDAAEIEGGSYCVLEGARWEEQRAPSTPRQQQQQQEQKLRSKKGAVGKGKRWRGKFGHLSDVSKTRSLPLVEPPTPRYVYDVFVVSASRTGAEGLGVPYMSGKGHARAVYSMAYVRGTGSARGPWGMFSSKNNDGTGGLLEVIWREGVWKVVLGCLHDVLGLGSGGGWIDDVD
ncbi:uncharacterized protein LY79DRAFT_519212 [Colletotrichum navitas]|uniref:Uncharacterized protein n=1 Tax=Colletotrichum navitas TaxID=681940 RepID=A0AAD8PWU2_9PEZI|nr:uncharacterized protein LY79DRAFT_519212 [Colletotrichum navitas]KAK1585273.1 hypothetical protein LY79DRAFT_519212 [Colletotrichum navitas]